jgi:outer membrane protein assembly factor BamB
MKINYIATLTKTLISGLSLGVLLGCSSTSDKLKAVDLGLNPGLLNVRLAWASNIGPVDLQLEPKAVEQGVLLANSAGAVVSINTANGVQSLQSTLGEKIASGLGAGAEVTAVVTRNNELITTLSGREVWRQKMLAQVFTAPLVAGGRVFVLAADRSVSAFDAASGRRLWLLQRPGESLVLRQSGVLLAVGETLVAGLSGQLVSINAMNGAIRWESPIASPRGTNEIERLVDLVGPVSRDGTIVCARAFQSAVGCVDAASGNLIWTKPASGSVGLTGDSKFVFGAESDGKLMAWRRSNGESVWVSERLKFRRLTAPVLLGRSIAVGDDEGNVHFVSSEDGTALAYLKTDGSAIVAGPILASGMLVVVTRNGGVFGIKPE